MSSASTPEQSREEATIIRWQAVNKVADAIGDGHLDLDLDPDEGDDILRRLQRLPAVPGAQQRMMPPPYTPKNRPPTRPGAGSGHSGHSNRFGHDFDQAEWLDWLPPEQDEKVQEGKQRFCKPISEAQLAILAEVAGAAHRLLETKPRDVLKQMLDRMLFHDMKALNLAPYLLAMLASNSCNVQHLAAADIEMPTTRKGIQTWPHYANQAADGMRPVIPVVEVGYSLASRTAAIQAADSLAQKEEACSGRCGNEPSKQYRQDRKAKNVNAAVFNHVESSDRKREQLSEQCTVELAHKRWMRKLSGQITFFHNTSGFDERALLRVWLVSEAELSKGCDNLRHSPEKEVWMAAERLLDTSEEFPMFFKAFAPVRLLLNVLWDMLKNSTEDDHKELLQRAASADLIRLQCKLEQACKVKACLLSSLYKHCTKNAAALFQFLAKGWRSAGPVPAHICDSGHQHMTNL